MVAPNTLRLNSDETIGIAAEENTVVSAYIQDYPGKIKNITQSTFQLTAGMIIAIDLFNYFTAIKIIVFIKICLLYWAHFNILSTICYFIKFSLESNHSNLSWYLDTYLNKLNMFFYNYKITIFGL